MTEYHRNLQLIGCLLMFTAVLFGAFGSHLLHELLLDNGRQRAFDTASAYHFYHALAILFFSSVGEDHLQHNFYKTGISLICVGVVLFCGSLYILALVDVAWLGAITPLGGLSMLLGWGCLSLDLIRSKLN